MTPNQALELMQQVDHFYNIAWQQLIWFGTSLAAIFGLLIPLFTYLYQKRLVQAEERQLLSKINELITQAKQDMRQEVLNTIAEGFKAQKAAIEATIADLKKEMETQTRTLDEKQNQAKQEVSKLEKMAVAGISGTQMTTSIQIGQHPAAFVWGITSLRISLEVNHIRAVRSVSETLIEQVLPNLNRKVIEEAKLGGHDISPLIEQLAKQDHDGIWTDLPPKLKRAFAAAQGR